jgi:MT0933-like antitoxin protein
LSLGVPVLDGEGASMGIDFEALKNKAEDLAEHHGDKIEQGVEKAGEFATSRLGHEETVDKAVDAIQGMIPDKPGQQPGNQE